MAPCTHPGMIKLFCLKAKNSFGGFALPALRITSREVSEARLPHACSSSCAFEENREIEKEKKKGKNRPTQNTPRYPQQPVDRDHLETALDETRPTR